MEAVVGVVVRQVLKLGREQLTNIKVYMNIICRKRLLCRRRGQPVLGQADHLGELGFHECADLTFSCQSPNHLNGSLKVRLVHGKHRRCQTPLTNEQCSQNYHWGKEGGSRMTLEERGVRPRRVKRGNVNLVNDITGKFSAYDATLRVVGQVQKLPSAQQDPKVLTKLHSQTYIYILCTLHFTHSFYNDALLVVYGTVPSWHGVKSPDPQGYLGVHGVENRAVPSIPLASGQCVIASTRKLRELRKSRQIWLHQAVLCSVC